MDKTFNEVGKRKSPKVYSDWLERNNELDSIQSRRIQKFDHWGWYSTLGFLRS